MTLPIAGHTTASAFQAADHATQQRLLTRVEEQMAARAADCDGVVARALAWHLAGGGGRFRARLAITAGLRLGLDHRDIVGVAAACELLHNASLIHDDLQDRDEMRRGRPSLWCQFGKDVALCAGDLLISASYVELAACGAPAASLLPGLHRAIARLISGQCADLGHDPASGGDAEAHYLATVAGKSGTLFALPLEISLNLAGQGPAAAQAVAAANQFAVGYQIYDDLQDYHKDLARGSLNAVAVLAGTGDEPRRRAAALATAALTRAVALARNLPGDCAALLRQQAATLARVIPAAIDSEVTP